VFPKDLLYAYHFCEVAVNGTAIGSAAHWERTARLNATKALHSGKNVITLAASHTDPYPPAVVGKLVVQFEHRGTSVFHSAIAKMVVLAQLFLKCKPILLLTRPA
jgi:hypothetical protein